MGKPVAMKDASALLDNPGALREQGRRDGYLFFRGLLDPKPIRAVRQQILEICARHGFLEPGVPSEKSQARDGFFIAESSSDPVYRAYYKDIQKLRDFHALAHHPDLLRIRSVIFGEEAMTHPLVILRTIFPNAVQHTTPPHQEYYFIHGSKQTWTAWIPLGDCSKSLGSLTVWPGSHKKGFLPVVPAEGGAGLIQVVFPEEPTWAEADYECGDFVTFHNLTVHKALPNLSENELRISLDCRAQPRSDPLIAPVSVDLPHLHPTDWDGVYEDWESDDPLRYYWRDYPLTLEKDAPAPVGTPQNPHPMV